MNRNKLTALLVVTVVALLIGFLFALSTPGFSADTAPQNNVVKAVKPLFNSNGAIETSSAPMLSYEIYALPNTSAPNVNSCKTQAECDVLSHNWTIADLIALP